jgi:uncharacterized protein YukE
MPDGSGVIRVDENENEGQAKRFEDLALRFYDDMRAERQHVEGLTWAGQARLGYIEWLDRIQGDFERSVAGTIEAAASSLRGATSNLIDTDAQVGSSFAV